MLVALITRQCYHCVGARALQTCMYSQSPCFLYTYYFWEFSYHAAEDVAMRPHILVSVS